MLKLLLDEHLSRDIAEGLRQRGKDFPVTPLADWNRGQFLGLADDRLLQEAVAQKLTLVTYDRKTISPVLKSWAETGRSHGGVIFIDEKATPLPILAGLYGRWKNFFGILLETIGRTELASCDVSFASPCKRLAFRKRRSAFNV